jgi:hypothetical protein
LFGYNPSREGLCKDVSSDQMQVDGDSDKEQDAGEQEPQDEVVVWRDVEMEPFRESHLNSLELWIRIVLSPWIVDPFAIAGPCYTPDVSFA